MMKLLARILSHGFALAVVALLVIVLMYRGEIFQEWELPDYLVIKSQPETTAEADSGTVDRKPDDTSVPADAAAMTPEPVAEPMAPGPATAARDEMQPALIPEPSTEPTAPAEAATAVRDVIQPVVTPEPPADVSVSIPAITASDDIQPVVPPEPLAEPLVPGPATAIRDDIQPAVTPEPPADVSVPLPAITASDDTQPVVPPEPLAEPLAPPGPVPAASESPEAADEDPASAVEAAAAPDTMPETGMQEATDAAADESSDAGTETDYLPVETGAAPSTTVPVTRDESAVQTADDATGQVDVEAVAESVTTVETLPATPADETAPAEITPAAAEEPVTTPDAVPAMEPVAAPETEAAPQTVDRTPSESAYAVLAKAREAFWLRDFEAAEQQYLKLIQLDPDNPDGFGEMGNMYFSQGKWDEAAAAYYEAGTRLLDEGLVDQARQMVDVIRGLKGSQADDLEAQIAAASAPSP